MTTTTETFRDQTIKLSELTFADWLAIASAAVENNRAKWAFYRWTDHTVQDLSDLSIEDWEYIEEQCEFKQGWAYHQYKQNR